MIRMDGLSLQYESLKAEIDTSVKRVLESGWFILGKELDSFEREFAGYLGRAHAVGVASGTEAIALSLMTLGIGGGDEVITSSLTAFPTIAGIMQAGARPVVSDINPETGLMDPASVESRITQKTRAILPIHLYGQSCDMDVLRSIAERHNLRLVEDCAHSVGAEYKGKKTGCLGDIAAFSFYPSKNLGAYGDGGAVLTDDTDHYRRLLRLRNYGKESRDSNTEFGINSRLDEIQAAILRVKLPYLDGWNIRRREHASYYREHLRSVCCLKEMSWGRPAYHLFVVKTQARRRLMDYLEKNNIQSLIHYPIPVHKQPAFPLGGSQSCRRAELFSGEVLSIPLYPELEEKDREKIVEVINGFK